MIRLFCIITTLLGCSLPAAAQDSQFDINIDRMFDSRQFRDLQQLLTNRYPNGGIRSPTITDLELSNRLFPTSDQIRNYNLDTVFDGADKQVVDPDVAADRHGGRFPNWMSRINGDPSFSGNGPGTCSAAVKGLFRLVCDGIANCEIEQAYRSSCVRGALAAQEAQECEAVVRNYVESCFGEPPMRPIDGWPAAKLVDRQRNTICSVSLVQANNANQTTFATSDHCPLATGDNRVERSRNFDLVESVLNNPPDGLNGDIKFGLLQDRVFGLGMPVRQPVLGQQTFFMGYNDLIAARNDLITMNNLNANRIPALKIDGSSLCTIVSISGSNLLHTCQTTKGGSGGALFQQGDNGSLFIVGINNGSGAAGQVSENDGIVLDN